jgi:hypothetical protein
MPDKAENRAFKLLSSRKTLVMATADKNGAPNVSYAPFVHRAPPPYRAESQRRSSFLDDRYAAARPITAPFIFESETAGLTFVQHRCPQSSWGFFRFPREDAAADYERGHRGKKNSEI